ncbi:MAG: phage holin family protein [Sphingomonadaceae bacterium]
MADSGPAPEAGVFASLRHTLASLVALAHTRLDLAVTELEEQRERLLALLLWGVGAVVLSAAAFLLCGLALVAIFWDTHRLLVAGLIGAASLVAAAVAIVGFRARAKARPRLLQSTLAELARDHDTLRRE